MTQQGEAGEQTVKVGIVGAKFGARLHAEAYKRCPNAKVVAAASINEDALSSFQKDFEIEATYLDYHEMLARDDLQLISVCVPNFLHKEVTLAAAAQGKHIVCEKPLATSVADAESMVKAASKHQVKLMYAEDWIFAPAVIRAVEICKEGGIGDVLYLRAKESHSGSHSLYTKKLQYCGGGSLIHLGIHPIGFSLFLLGNEVDRVTCVKTGGLKKNLLHNDFEGEDWGIGILEYSNGKVAQVEGNYVTFGGMDDTIEIFGTEGVIKVDLTQGSPLRVFSREGLEYTVEKAEVKTGWSFPAVDEYSSLGYQDEIKHFVGCVQGRHELKKGVRGEDGLEALKILSLLYESARQGKSTKIEPVTEEILV